MKTLWYDPRRTPLYQDAGITLGTLVKAAWSYVLSQFTRIVFEQTFTGRGLSIPGVDAIQGPCLNFIPFRTTVEVIKLCYF